MYSTDATHPVSAAWTTAPQNPATAGKIHNHDGNSETDINWIANATTPLKPRPIRPFSKAEHRPTMNTDPTRAELKFQLRPIGLSLRADSNAITGAD